MKNFIKNNKVMTVALIISIVFVILIFVLKFTIFSNGGTAVYGDRLEGIEEVEITSKQQKDIVTALKEKEEVKKAECDIQGRILNVIITVNDEVELEKAKALTSSIVDNLEEDQKSYYDIQVFVKKTNDDARFPIIGYKHQDKDGFSWTKDR